MKWNPGSGVDGGLCPGLRYASSGLQRRKRRGCKDGSIGPTKAAASGLQRRWDSAASVRWPGFCSPDGMKWNPGSGASGGLGPGLRYASSGLQRRKRRGCKDGSIGPTKAAASGLQRRWDSAASVRWPGFCSPDGMKWNPGSGASGGLGPGLRYASSGLQRRRHWGYKGGGAGATKAVASGL